MSLEFIRFRSSFPFRLKSKLLRDAILNGPTQKYNREKIRPKHNLDEKDRYKSARKTMGVVKVIRHRGEPKVKYLSQSKI